MLETTAGIGLDAPATQGRIEASLEPLTADAGHGLPWRQLFDGDGVHDYAASLSRWAADEQACEQ